MADAIGSGLVLGALVGIVMGLTGAGGGILAVPLLVFGMQLTVAEAGPIGLLAVGVSAAAGALIGLKANIVRYRAAVLIAAAGILMAPLGVALAHRLDTRLLSLLFAAVLGWIAYKTLREISGHRMKSTSARLAAPCMRDTGSGRFIWTSRCAAALSVSGGIAGVLSGLLGVGGGFVMVPALQRYTDLASQSVVATSLAVISLVSLAGVAASVTAGHFNVAIALPFAAGSVAGMGVGNMLTSRLPEKFLKTAFALVCLAVATAMVVKFL
jgi:uncharacterized membrane protein YfcA